MFLRVGCAALVSVTLGIWLPCSAFDEGAWCKTMDEVAFAESQKDDVRVGQLLSQAQSQASGDRAAVFFTLNRMAKLQERHHNLKEAETYSRRAVEEGPPNNYPDTLIDFYQRTGRAAYADELKQKYASKNPPDAVAASYMRTISAQIKSHWHPAPSRQYLKLNTMWAVHKDGSVSHIFVDQSSGNQSVDEEALRAVTSAVPLPPPPSPLPEPTFISFSFEIKVHGNGNPMQWRRPGL